MGARMPRRVQGLDLLAKQVEAGVQVRVPFRPVSRIVEVPVMALREDGDAVDVCRGEGPSELLRDRTQLRRLGPQDQYGSRDGSSVGESSADRP